MNKKAFLLAEETLKIILAVIAISFLIYFLVSLYTNSQKDKDLEEAKSSLEHLVNEINSMDDDKITVEIYNPISSNKFPGGWILISFPLGEAGPNSCNNLGWKNCLCICNEASTTVKDTGFAEDCDKNGFCLENDFKIENKKIRLENPPITLQINSNTKIITQI